MYPNTGFGNQNQQPQSNPGFFGGGGGGFGTGGMTQGGFGQLAQNPQTPMFGQAATMGGGGGGFGGTQGGAGIFGQTTGGFGGGGFGGNAPQNQSSGTFNTFSQAANKQQFGQPTGGFGATQSGFGGNQFGGGLGGGLSGNQPQQQPQLQQQSSQAYYKGQFEQTLTTHGFAFTSKQESLAENQKSNQTGHFFNIRAEPKFAVASSQMLKVLDTLAMLNNAPQPSYEALAGQEYQQNSQNYVHNQKVSGQQQQQQQPGMMGGGSASGGFFGQSTGGFSQGGGFGQNTPAWGGGAQTTPMFGGTQSGFNQAPGTQLKVGMQQSTGGNTLFSGQQNKPLFGQNQPASTMGMGGGIFGQQQQQQQPSLLGGGMNKPATLFGQTPQANQGFGGGGGIFGQPSQPATGGGIFGNTGQQTPGFGPTQNPPFGQQQQTSNIFGATPLGQQQQQQQPGGGLFNQNQSTGQGLFGGGQGGSTLFGGQQAQSTGLGLGATGQQTGLAIGAQSSLFGKPAAQPSSLFSNQAQQPSTGVGLFQQPSTQQSSLFGNKPQAQQLGGGLFNQTPLSQPSLNQQSSLFGGLQAQQQPSLGLQQSFNAPTLGFQQPSQNQQPQLNQQTSMFTLGSQAYQQQPQLQQQQSLNPYFDPVKKTDPFGASSFLASSSSFDNVDEEIKKIKEEAENNNKAALACYKDDTPFGEYQTVADYIVAPYMQNPVIFISEDEERRAGEEQLMKRYEQIISQRVELKEEKPVYSMRQGFTAQKAAQPLKPQKSFGTDSNWTSRQNTIVERQTYQTPDQQLYMPKQDSMIAKSSSINKNILREENLDLESKPNINEDVITVQVIYPESQGKQEKVEPIKIHKSRDVADLFKKVEKTLREEKRMDESYQDFILIYKNAKLNLDHSLKEAGIQSNTKVQVIFKNKKGVIIRDEDLGQQMNQRVSQSENQSPSLVPKERIPKQTKQGYQMSPTLVDLGRMTMHELQNVRNFKIWNEHGSIQFEGATDLTDVDLDVITIEPKSAEVYNEKIHQKPPEGQKLNKPAIITLRNIDPKRKTLEEKEQLLQKKAQECDTQHISYNNDRKEWSFKVFHFTKYALDDDEEEEEANLEQQQQPIQSQVDQMRVSPDNFIKNLFLNNQTKPLIYDTGTQQQKLPQQQQSKIQEHFDQQQQQKQDTLWQIQQQQQQIPTDTQQKFQQLKISMLKPKLSGKENLDLNEYEQQQYRARIDNDNESSIVSSVMGKEYPDEDMIILRKESSKQPLIFQQQLAEKIKKKTDLAERIRAKDKAMSEVGKKLFEPRMSQQDTLKFLKDKLQINVQAVNGKLLKLNKFKKEELKREEFKSRPTNNLIRFRPQFRNDGSLLILKPNQNKLQLVKIPIAANNQPDAKKIYQTFTDILLSQVDVKPFENYLKNNFDTSQTKYDDYFMGQLFANLKLPILQFKQLPNDLFYLLDRLAGHLAEQIKSKQIAKKLQDEFFVICALNAIYGNPNVHLVQLHPEFKGIKNYVKCKDLYANPGSDKNFEDGYTIFVDKKRKNALIELLRFICQQEFTANFTCKQGSKNDLIYDNCLQYLLNGDLIGAVSHLNEHKKHKMAQHVLQCFNSEASKQLLQEEFKAHANLYKGFNKSAKALVDFMSGTLAMNGQDWKRALLYQLLVVSNPVDTLDEIIQDFTRKTYPVCKIPERTITGRTVEMDHLIWVVIKIYAFSVEGPHGNYKHLNRQLLPYLSVQDSNPFNDIRMDIYYDDIQDHRTQFLVALAFKNLSKHYSSNRDHYAIKYKDFSVPDQIFTNAASLYSNQLLRENDWKQALLIALLIPHSYKDIKKPFIFDILQKKAMHFNSVLKQTKTQEQLQKLGIPAELIHASSAILYQYRGLYEKAMNGWMETGNYQATHDILINKIAPLYFNSAYQSQTSDNQDIINKKEAKQKQIYNLLKEKLESKKEEIQNWSAKGDILLRFLILDNNIKKNLNTTETDIKMLASVLNSELVKKEDPIQRYIWEYILQQDSRIKIDRCREEASRDQFVGSKKEPMEEVIQVYPDNPDLARYYDDYADQNLTWVYCSQKQKEHAMMMQIS